MNKNLLLYLLLIASLLLVTCRKQQTSSSLSSDQSLIKAASRYFNDSIASQQPITGLDASNLRLQTAKLLQWRSAFTMATALGQAVVVPVLYDKDLHLRTNFAGNKLFALNELARLFLYHDKTNRWHAELVTAFPDSTYLQRGGPTFSGLIFVETWSGQRLRQYQYNPDGTVLQLASLSNPARHQTHAKTPRQLPLHLVSQ